MFRSIAQKKYTMKLKKRLSIFILLMLSPIVWAQEGLPIYSDYLTDNYYLIHPSMAGAARCAQIRLTGRKNWIGQKDSPGLYTLAYNGRLSRQSGIGGQVFQDRNGFTSQTGVFATYAHHLMFSRGESDLEMLSFGLSAGFIQYQLDESSFVPDGDALFSGGGVSSIEFNVDFGMSYHFQDFYAHGTLKNVLENSGINNDLQATSNLRNFLFSVGYVFNRFNKKWSFEPSLLFSNRPSIGQSRLDVNLKTYYDTDSGRVWGGLSYRKGLSGDVILDGEASSQGLSYITPFFGVNFKKYMIAYTYSYQSDAITFNNGGFHQITLGFDFSCKSKPLTSCYCPSINGCAF